MRKERSLSKVRSYPERLGEQRLREAHENSEALTAFRLKDHARTEELARLGSRSSRELATEPQGSLFVRLFNYLLERGEEERRRDEEIREKSYAGFYYFLKWFSRSLFLIVSTVIGNIAGKEVGCLITDHRWCTEQFFSLWYNSPSLLASFLGSLFGLFLGQWVGKVIWDQSFRVLQECFERWRTRSFWLAVLLLYLSGIVALGMIFRSLVIIFADRNQTMLVGFGVGGVGGGVIAWFAYRKKENSLKTNSPLEERLTPPELV